MNDDTLLQNQEAEVESLYGTEPATPVQQVEPVAPVYGEDVASTDTRPLVGTVKKGSEGFLGHNDIYADVVPFKLNIFGEDIETKTTNSHKLAQELATKYNGRSLDDYYGFYFAPVSETESIVSAGMKGLINSFANIPYDIGSIASAIARNPLTLTAGFSGMPVFAMQKAEDVAGTTEAYQKYQAGAEVVGNFMADTGRDITNWLQRAMGTDAMLDDSLRTKISAGVGSGIGSIIGMILGTKYLKAGSMASSVVMNGSVYDEVYRSARDKGYSPLNANGRAIAALGTISALDKYGFEKWTSMFRGVTKEVLGLSAENIAKQEVAGLIKEAARTESQAFWRSAAKGATRFASEPMTETFQNNVQRVMAGDMDKGYTKDMFDEDAVTLASTMIISALGLPAEIRSLKAERTATKTVVAQYANQFKQLQEVRGQFVDKLVSSGASKEMAEKIADDVLENGTEHARTLVQDANLSLIDGLTEQDVKDFQQRLGSIDVQSLAAAKFKELDARVVKSLENVDMKASDKMLVRACYQGISNWMAYYGVSPDQIEPSTIYTDRRAADAKRTTYGHFRPTDQSLYFAQGKEWTGSPYDSLVANLNAVDDSIEHRLGTIIHEFSHMLDYKMLGINPTDASKFLTSYMGAIKEVFGERQADNVKDNLGKYNRGFGRRLDYTSRNNSTEWFAQAMGRLGHKAADYIGLKRTPANFVMFANSMLDSADQFDLLTKPLQDYMQQYRKFVKENSSVIKAMAKERGSEKINSLFQRMQDNPDVINNQTLITPAEAVELYDIANSFLDSESAKIASDIYEGIDMSGFGKIIDDLRMFNTALESPEATEGQLQASLSDRVLNEDGTVSESYVDVNDVLDSIQREAAMEKKTGKSSLQRQLDREIDGISLLDDFKETKRLIEEKQKQGPLGWLYKKLLGSSTSYGITEFVRAIGGDKLEKRFGLLAKHEAYDNAVISKHDRLTNRIQKEVLGVNPKDAASSVALQKLDNELSIKNIEVEMVDPRDKSKSIQKRNISQFELMDAYLDYMQTERYVDEFGIESGLSPRERLQKIFPTMELGDLIKKLDPRAKKYADIMAEEIRSELPTFKKALEDMGMNADFKAIKNYWPLTTAIYQAEGQDYTNVTIARQATESALGVFDAREKYNRYMSRVAATESQFYPAIRRLRDLFFFKPQLAGEYNEADEAKAEQYKAVSRDLQYQIQQRLGQDAYDQFNKLVDDFLNTRADNILSDSMASMMGRNLTTALLEFKPIQAVKNFSNFFSHWGMAKNQGAYWANTVRGLANPKQTWETMMKYSTLCRKRLRGMSYSEYVNQQTSGGDSLVGRLFKQGAERNAKWTKEAAPAVSNFLALNNVVRKLGMSPMLLGDAGSNVFGGYGLFMELVEKNNGDMEAAGKEFDETILRRQSSSNQATKSLIQRQWGRDFRGTFIAFTSEALNKTRDFVRAIERVKEGEISAKEAVLSNTSLLTSIMAYSLISAGAWDLLSDDDDKKKEAGQGMLDELISQVGGTTIFGSAFVVPVIRMVLGEYSTGVSNAPLSEFYKFARNINATATGKNEDVANVFLQALTIAGVGVGAPNALNSLRGASRATSGKTEAERRAGLRQSFGYSESSSNKREGIKPAKKTVEKDDEE